MCSRRFMLRVRCHFRLYLPKSNYQGNIQLRAVVRQQLYSCTTVVQLSCGVQSTPVHDRLASDLEHSASTLYVVYCTR